MVNKANCKLSAEAHSLAQKSSGLPKPALQIDSGDMALQGPFVGAVWAQGLALDTADGNYLVLH